MTSNFWRGFWRLADPKISLTSAAAIYIGASVAAGDGPFSWTWLALTLLAFFAVEVAKNAWGDVYDYDSGVDLAVSGEDRTQFSGGKRVLVDRLLTRRQTWGMAIGFGLTGILIGVVIVMFREPNAFWIGLVGFAIGWSYHGPPFRLVYRGWGEAVVVLIYGPTVALAAYLIQTHQLSWQVFWLSLPLGIVIGAFLWVNEFPDYRADRSGGKFNLVARLGRRRASRILPLIYLAAFVVLAAVPLTGLPQTVWLGGLAAIPAAYASYQVWRHPETFHRSRPVQPAALVTFLVYSAGAGTGVLLG
ncbi:MAG: prenyltransferase [Thioalkalivibrio sp.]|nr:prenyltransferase [Thioalkalivibrio sp.]